MVNFSKTYTTLIENLKNGKDCIIVDVDLRTAMMQKKFQEIISKEIFQIKIVWKCFENNLEKATINLKKRTNKGDFLGHMAINEKITHDYSIPNEAEILPIVTNWNK